MLKDKVAVITGAGSGIGAATAKQFAEKGARVVAADVDDSGGKETVEAITDAGGNATFVHTDVSREEEVKSMIEIAIEKYGGLDILFNNAGIEGPSKKCAEYDVDSFDELISVNLRGVFLGIKYGTQAMLTTGGGSIINTSSIASQSGTTGRCAYTASKAGINGLTRVSAVEYAEDNIRVNAVLPGIIDTPMVQRADEQQAERESQYETAEPMAGMGHPEDIANAVVFLGSDLASRITGVTLPVDGGFLVKP